MDSPTSTPQSGQLRSTAVSGFIQRYWRAYLLLFLIAALIVAFDQWTKVLVRANIPLGGDWLPGSMSWLLPYARVRHWYNTGAAFGLFKSGSLIFTFLAIVVSGLIVYYYPRVTPGDWWLRLAMGMQLGGALGNLIDRLVFQGRVTDFISVGNFAVFNVADASISTGTAVLVLGVWLRERQIKKTALLSANPSAEANESKEGK